tara:strand:- start:135 stop:431 length:297 start_codon:yes stop_codon:yes gene_type:complete
MQTYLITWECPDAKTQFEAGKAFVDWFESGGETNNPKGFERVAWCSLMQNGSGVSIVKASSLNVIWEVYGKWRKMGLTINIQPASSMQEAAKLFKELQ